MTPLGWLGRKTSTQTNKMLWNAGQVGETWICQALARLQLIRLCYDMMDVWRILRPEIASGRPNWTSKTYCRLEKFLVSVQNRYLRCPKLSKSPPTFNELYDVCPAYLSEICHLCSLSLKDVPLSACRSFIDSRVTCRGTLLIAVWSLRVFVKRVE